ncbi:proline-rich 33 kDa extensin-related protein-like [Perca flavescens]|uniref:proline-rich 33 kDa extensin-related protein-like n=1 Tax=Perca flavescens TaxID=8167 RepID=UPI00106E2E2E|nr:proline-rich 33 kDa extensin-related protein-like [Perca flavescens]
MSNPSLHSCTVDLVTGVLHGLNERKSLMFCFFFMTQPAVNETPDWARYRYRGPARCGPALCRPVHNRPVHNRPVHSGPVHNRPVHNRPVHSGPVHNRPVHNISVHSGPVHNRPVHNRPVHNRPVHSGPVHNRPVHNRPVHSGPVHSGPVHNRPVHNRPVHNRPVHSGPVHRREPAFPSAQRLLWQSGSGGGPAGFHGDGSKCSPLLKHVVCEDACPPPADGNNSPGPELCGTSLCWRLR